MPAVKTKSVRRTGRRSRAEIKRLLEAALRADFPSDTVDVSDGFRENIHVLVISRKFEKMKETVRQDWLWTLIDRSPLTPQEKNLISLTMALSPGELK